MAKSGETRTVAAMFGAAGDASKRSAKRSRHSSVSGSSFAECPVCFRPFHPALIQSHAAECAGAAESPDRRKTPRSDRKARDTPAPSAAPPADPPRDACDVSTKNETSRRPNLEPALDASRRENVVVSTAAFASLMDAQKSAKCELVFCAWLDALGAWRWTLERGTAPGPAARAEGFDAAAAAWSATAQFKEKAADGKPCATTVRLVTSVAPEDASAAAALASTWAGGGARANLSPSVLKSAVQKAVRRGACGPARRCALALLHAQPAECLRRLAVIAVEDATAHPRTPLLVWFMAAQSKGYLLGAAARDAVARVAAELAACDVKDALGDPDPGPGPGDAGSDADPLRNLGAARAGLSDEHGALVCALLMRARFGGMRGDVEMLRAAAGRWRRRLLAEPWDWTKGLHVTFARAAERAERARAAERSAGLADEGTERIASLSRRDVPLAAVDFHVSPVLERLLELDAVRAAAARAVRAAPALAGDDGGLPLANALRSAMWAHGSSVTTKRTLASRADLTARRGPDDLDAGSEPVLETPEARALATLWEEVSGAASGFQRRFIASRVQQTFFGE